MKPLHDKTCETCNQVYQANAKTQRNCHTCKSTLDIQKSNSKWLNRKPREFKPSSNSVAYHFFRKRYGPSKIYNACRG